MSEPFQLLIPEEAWTENDALDRPSDHLHVSLVINGLAMHLEAWAVWLDLELFQETVNPAYRPAFNHLYAAVGASGHMETVTIRDRQYILVATPHSG